METNLRNLETSTLLDLLVRYTNDYNRIFHEGGTPVEFDEIRRTISEVQNEIIFRKRKEVISMADRHQTFSARSTG